MSGKGGARRFSKPYVDSGAIFNALTGNESIVEDMGAYEHLRSSNAADPKGLTPRTWPIESSHGLQPACHEEACCFKKGS